MQLTYKQSIEIAEEEANKIIAAGARGASKKAKAANKNLKPVVKKNQKHFIYKSSPGRPPNWASVPWLGIFDPNVTTSPQRGYYLALLFSVDMKRIY